MSDFTPVPIDADDPGLTAFALGELEGTDAAQYAERVRQSPELQTLVQQIQSEAQLLSEELQLEPATALTSERRSAIVHKFGSSCDGHCSDPSQTSECASGDGVQ
jgi:hypothetical protein